MARAALGTRLAAFSLSDTDYLSHGRQS
ncbi:hypothetical protein EMIT0373P_21002 [Pseudomonas chlororaphis]